MYRCWQVAAGKRWVIRLDLPLTLVTSSDAAAAGANTSNSDYRHLQVQNKQLEVNYSSSGSITAAGWQVFHLDPSLDPLVTSSVAAAAYNYRYFKYKYRGNCRFKTSNLRQITAAGWQVFHLDPPGPFSSPWTLSPPPSKTLPLTHPNSQDT